MAQRLNALGQPVDENGNIMTAGGQSPQAINQPYQYAQPLSGGAQGSVAPSYYQNYASTPAAPAATTPTVAPASTPTMSGVSGQIMDLYNPQGTSGTPTPAANPFAGQINSQLNTPAPTAPTAQTFTPQGMPAAPTQVTGGPNPFAGGLTASEQKLQDLINNPSSLQDSASYKFRVDQGQQALERSLGAKGMLQSGNRLTDLTAYGQGMGSQEYEAENARRLAALNSYSGSYNTAQGNENARVGQANATGANIYGTQVGGVNAANTTNAAAVAAANTAANNLYGINTTARTAQTGTVADLYSNANTAANNLYGINTTAATAQGNTLADLYRTDTTAQTAKLPYQQAQIGTKPYWASPSTVGQFDQRGNRVDANGNPVDAQGNQIRAPSNAQYPFGVGV